METGKILAYVFLEIGSFVFARYTVDSRDDCIRKCDSVYQIDTLD